RRECRQQIAWFGDLARSIGQRTVAVFSSRDEKPEIFAGNFDCTVSSADEVGSFVYEPHSAVLAPQLGDALAATNQLERICFQAPYYTSDSPVPASTLIDAFAVVEILPFDIKRLNAALAARQIGELEIKKRGVEMTPEQLRKRLRLNGDQQATLIIVPT